MYGQYSATEVPANYVPTPYQTPESKELTYAYFEFPDTQTGITTARKVCLETDAGAIFDARTGHTWLHIAALTENEFLLIGFTKLSRNSANLEARNNQDYTPLMVALEAQKERSVECLLDAGADIHAFSKTCGSALHLAAKTNTRIMQLIFQKRQGSLNLELESAGNTPLYTAIRAGCTDIAEMLINAGVVIHNENTRSPLTTAAYAGNTRLVQTLLSKGAKICSCSLIVAYLENVMDDDLKKREIKDASPLFGAVNNGADIEMIQALVEAGDDPCRVLSDGSNILYWAVNNPNNSSAVLAYLLKLGADPNQRCSFDGLTPLLNARNVEHISLLLDHQADPNVLNREGKSALSEYCFGFKDGDAERIEVLLNHDAKLKDDKYDFFFRFADNHTKPQLASQAFKLTQLFFTKGAKLNSKIKQKFDESFLVKENPEFKKLIEEHANSDCVIL